MVTILGQIHILIITLFFDMISGISDQMAIPHSHRQILLSFAPDRLRHLYKQKFSNLWNILHRVMLWYSSAPLNILSSVDKNIFWIFILPIMTLLEFSYKTVFHYCHDQKTLLKTFQGKYRETHYGMATKINAP